MGKQIYLSNKEIDALVSTAGEWCEIMSSGDDTLKDVDNRLKSGLGSAIYKLSNNGDIRRIYSKYVGK